MKIYFTTLLKIFKILTDLNRSYLKREIKALSAKQKNPFNKAWLKKMC